MKKITYQFEVAEEEARFARNDVHNEALTDFKKMHSQRHVFMVDCEPRKGGTWLIQCFLIQGGTIQRAGGLGNGLCHPGEEVSGGVRSRPCSERRSSPAHPKNDQGTR